MVTGGAKALLGLCIVGQTVAIYAQLAEESLTLVQLSSSLYYQGNRTNQGKGQLSFANQGEAEAEDATAFPIVSNGIRMKRSLHILEKVVQAPAQFARQYFGSTVQGAVVSPKRVNSHTGGDVLVTLQNDLPQGVSPFCFVESNPHGWDSVYARDVPARAQGRNQVLCSLPVHPDADGLIALKVGYGSRREVVDLEFVTPLAASFSMSPYYNTDSGELLVRTDFSGAWTEHQDLRVRARTTDGVELLDQEVPTGKTHHVFPVSFQYITEHINEVDVTLMSGSDHELLSRRVRLLHVRSKKRGRVAVDHKSRSLQVDGRPFLPISWFASLEHGTESAINDLRNMARRGVNSVMMYNLVPAFSREKFKRGEPLPWVVLDACVTLGIKVHAYVLDLAESLADKFDKSDDNYEALGDAITSLKDHPAILSWYVADDDSGEDLPKLYRYIKGLDPNHPVSIAIAFPRQQYKDRFIRGADIIMTETYPADGDAAYKVMQISNHYPTMFMPAVTCGRAWTLEEDGRVISREVFRSQLYHALIAGATGEVWFRYHDAKGWNNPGIPLLEESGELARELLEMVPSILSSGPWDQNTSVPEATAYGVHQNGTRAASDEAMRAKVFRESSGMVTLIVANGRNEPMQAVVNLGHGTPGVYDDNIDCTNAMVPFEASSWQSRRVKVCQGLVKEWLPAWGVQMFRFNGTSTLAKDPLPSYASALAGLMQQRPHSLRTEGVDGKHGQNLIINPSFETSSSFVSAPDGWFCGMADPPKGQHDSSCFADTSIGHWGRHSGRFVTGANPYLFRMRPSTWVNTDEYMGRLSDGVYHGSVYAQADQPMELTAVKLTAHTPGDAETPVEQTIARQAIGEEWTRMRFTLVIDDQAQEVHSAGLQLAFKASQPGVVWLDSVELYRQD